MEQQAAAEREKIAAEADAEVRRMQAEADAYAIEIKAEAEAEANKAIAASLTPELIDYEYATGWNGELPDTMLGADAVPVIGVGENAD